jgi:two-component system, sensor histidine kinase and response regulator
VSDKQADIMIVDDVPANLDLLTNLLSEAGYRARPLPNGRLALQAARSDPPDLILLDINMPEMNGLEVCAQLKADPDLAEIPVIFISGLTETLDKVTAFGAGAVDYIIKPFHFEEVYARVKTHLELNRQKRELQQAYDRLRDLESLRDNLVHMIVHDMRNPLSVIILYGNLIKNQTLPEKAYGYVTTVLQSALALEELVASQLAVSKLEAGEMILDLEANDMEELVRQALEKAEPHRQARTITLAPPVQPITVICDAHLITRVVQNILNNALKFTDKETGVITIHIEPVNGATGEEKVCVRIIDNGPGIPAAYQERVFEKFGQVKSQQGGRHQGTGLGLAFCKLAVEAHAGRIGVESESGKGCTFWFELPGRPPAISSMDGPGK